MAIGLHISRLLARWRARPATAPQVEATLSTHHFEPAVAAAQAALREFGECSSREFTQIAEDVSTLHGKLGAVRTQAAQLDSILQETDDDRALSSAFELFKRSVDLAHASIGIALSQEEQMEQMEAKLLQNRNRFGKNSLMFRVLVMNIRAEAARIPTADRAVFVAVAGEMDAMERQMSATVETAFSKLETIVHEGVTGRYQLQNLKESLHENAQRSIALLRNELDEIKSGLAPCIHGSREINALLEKARHQTGALITSLQYQDIVSQQLAHVSQGFDDMGGDLNPAANATPDFSFLNHAARVQRTHLGTSRRAIQDASDRIGDAGRSLLATGAALVERFGAMEKSADAVFSKSRVGEKFKQETETLVRTAGQSEVTNERIARLLDRIEDAVSTFSTEIRHHELEVQLVALNAQIAAARMPDARALNKLAEETAQLSHNAADLTRMMREQLAETLSHLKVMRKEGEDVRETIGREKSELARGSEIVTAKLARFNDRIHRSSGEAARQFDVAYRQVRDLLPSLQFPQLIAPSFEPSESLCDLLLAATADYADKAMSVEGAQRIAVHESRYTMQEEREAHSAAVTKSAPSPAVPAAAAAVAAVELFDEEPAPSAPAVVTRTTSSALPPASPATPPASFTEPAATPALATVAAGGDDLGAGVELF